MKTAQQLSVFLVNKPGVLANVTSALSKAKVNIVAMTLMDSMEHGVLRMVAKPEAKAAKVIDRLNLSHTETEVMILSLPNRSGALASVVQQLADAHVNISYAYCTAGAPGGKTTGVFKVSDLKKAERAVKPRKAKSASRTEKSLRRSPATRKK